MKNFRPGVLLNTAKYRGQIAVILQEFILLNVQLKTIFSRITITTVKGIHRMDYLKKFCYCLVEFKS